MSLPSVITNKSEVTIGKYARGVIKEMLPWQSGI
jgi:hypothetical protein